MPSLVVSRELPSVFDGAVNLFSFIPAVGEARIREYKVGQRRQLYSSENEHFDPSGLRDDWTKSY